MEDRRRIRMLLWEWGRVPVMLDELADRMKGAAGRLRGLYEDATGGGQRLDGLPRSTVPGDPVYRAVERLDRMRELCAQEIEACEERARELTRWRDAMDAAIDDLAAEAREIVRMRYQKGHTWAYVGIKMHMDEATARRIEREACDRLAEVIGVSGM